MTFDLPAILASKQALRQSLAARPLLEKLRLLDSLAERACTLRAARSSAQETTRVREEPPADHTPPR
ncbi:hypothetical protein BH20VER1_BH20VER1_24730 [soil metagenome]